MTAPLRTPHSHSHLPASQTAPVAEFRCLYTPDIRKKQKKWHDGFLKFHSFNSRVMVYDQARNFLGDTYYKDSDELHEGDELTLDKGVMVEVADPIAVTHTDLAPLFEKKPKDAPPPPTAPPRRFHPPSQVARPSAQQPRHKSLNTLLGTPKGPMGKAVPIKSPYEARQEKENENDFAVDRAAKRQKTAHRSTSSATLRLSSPAQEESPAPRKSLPSWAKLSATKTTRPIPQGAPVITLDELDDVAPASSDPSFPSTPPAASKTTTTPAVTPAPPVRPAVPVKPALQTPRIPRGKVPVPSVKALETPQAPAPASSPPVSASNRLSNVDFAIQPTPAKEPISRPSKQPSPPPPPLESTKSPPRNPKAKSLRLSKGVKRGTLMICQPQPPPPRLHPRGASGAQIPATKLNTARRSQVSRPSPSPTSEDAKTPVDTSASLVAPKSKRKATADGDDTAKRARQLFEKSLDIFDDDQEIVHGLMDQQLLMWGTPPTEPILVPASPGQVLSRPKAAKSASRNSRRETLSEAEEVESIRKVLSTAKAPTGAGPKKKPAQKSQAAGRPSPPAAAVVEGAEIQSRAASPALSAVLGSRSRTASSSPRKTAALSTGGFHKKSKRAIPQPALPQQTDPVPDKPLEAHRNDTVALPPHLLRVNKNGPVMTTTELAAMLQQQKKRPKPPADPIEDSCDVPGISPNRKFRRVRSENDAPIPSTSEHWEKKNLPKPAPAATETEPVIAVATRKRSGLAALIKKTDPRKKFARTQSLTIETSIPPAQDTDSPMVSPVVDKDIGPWSTEAFDLFDWRPPRPAEVDSQSTF